LREFAVWWPSGLGILFILTGEDYLADHDTVIRCH
jgi:hypothetical protein